jgi:hypothetical protein
MDLQQGRYGLPQQIIAIDVVAVRLALVAQLVVSLGLEFVSCHAYPVAPKHTISCY